MHNYRIYVFRDKKPDPVLIFPSQLQSDVIKHCLKVLKISDVTECNAFTADMQTMIFSGIKSEKRTGFPYRFSKLP
jgi:hypothetical protein